MSNLAKIDQILARSKTLLVEDHEIELKLPSREKLSELRQLQISAAKFSDEEMRSEEGLRFLSGFSTKCVAYTLDIDETYAEAFIFATGGEGGELYKEIQKFLGFAQLDDDESIDDPS